ncbi:winged helix-turn-helix domain-containing protein [Halalkalicoccus tibetensis]|uniref:Winged helix-turn-helix domain-containing protein n=1 Tax=Halalkalicoccus tibetensis TaxID=175632 RepID=A0ABD5UWZ3_9EURY
MNRFYILKSLRNQPARPCELVSQYSISRPTVQRILADLSKLYWIRKEQNRYRITSAGEQILDSYEELYKTIKITSRWDTFLAQLGNCGSNLPLSTLTTATITMKASYYNDDFRLSFERTYVDHELFVRGRSDGTYRWEGSADYSGSQARRLLGTEFGPTT